GTLLVEIRGKGNIPMINAPAVNWPDAVQAYDPSAKEDIQPEKAPLTGTKHFEYIFTAKDTGDITIPAVKFAFFDPVSQSYKTDSTRAINVRVVPGVKKAEVRKPLIALSPSTRNMWLWIAGGALLTLLVIGWVIFNSRRKHNRIAVPVKKAEALTPAPVPVKRDPLDKARRLLTDAPPAIFIKEVESVTWSEAGEKFNIPPVALNQPQVVMSLRQHGADESTIQSFRDLMHDCEYALYIPGQTFEDLEGILKKAEQFLEKLNEIGY
ncbi:MAG TPA: BatD family protein, partial [Chitinophagaceae bacterium]|nr:BatD family protein [Chitinophagaceae bacterium]